MVPTLAGVILFVFFLFKFFGGDPAEILGGLLATPEQIEAIRQQLGLNDPWYVQLWIFIKSIFTFNWGNSWATGEAISNIFRTRLPATLTVMIPILILDTVLGIIAAMAVAYVRGSVTDRAIMVITTVMLSISFLVYIIVGQWLFGFYLGWFPVQGWSDSFFTNLTYYAVLPVSLAVFVSLAPQTRLYRSFFLDEINQDYVRTARAKGVGENRVLFTHVLRNAMIPVLTNVALAVAGRVHRLVPDRSVLLDPGAGARNPAGGQPQRLPGDSGGDDLSRGADDADQSDRRHSVQSGRPEGRTEMIPAATIESIRVPPEPTRSRGVWVTAWRRLKNDRVGMVSLVIVLRLRCWCCSRFWASSPATGRRKWRARCAADIPRAASRADGYRSAGKRGRRRTRSRWT